MLEDNAQEILHWNGGFNSELLATEKDSKDNTGPEVYDCHIRP